jgi:hypothetical protein
MASKADFQTAVDNFSAEVDRLRAIITPLNEKIILLDRLNDPNLPSKLAALKAEYREFSSQNNPPDATIKRLQEDMIREGNALKAEQETDEGKAAIGTIVSLNQQSWKRLVPLAVLFKDEQKSLEKWIEDRPERYGGATDTAASSSSQETSRVNTEATKLSTSLSFGSLQTQASRITNPSGFGLNPTSAGIGLNPDLAAVGFGIGASLSGTISNVRKGTASILDGDIASATLAVEKATNRVNELGRLLDPKTFQVQKIAGGPPYPNILEEFASYAPLWTMAALTPSQFNDPASYRGRPSALQNVVFSSGGRYGDKRAKTIVGEPEYFVNNFNFTVVTAMNEKTGNTNAMQFTWDVFEPYSMGYFLHSLQSAAIDSGWTNYNEAPFLLKLEFVGYKDDGAVFEASEYLTKYLVVQLKNVTFTTNEGGSMYKVEAIAYNHTGWSSIINQTYNDVVLKGETVKELLSEGKDSFIKALNEQQLKMVADNLQQIPDTYVIVFPENWADTVGLNTGGGFADIDLASFTPQEDDEGYPIPQPYYNEEDYGWGEIGASSMGFSASTGGNYLFGLESDVVDSSGVINRAGLKIDPTRRTFSVSQNTSIQNAIAAVVLSSEYSQEALDPNNIDVAGRIKWFRIDVQVQVGELDFLRNCRAKKYIFRVVPYYVHSSVFRNPSAAPPGYEALSQMVAKEYRYIYTGQNNDVLKFDISINYLFTQGLAPVPPMQSDLVYNDDTKGPSEDPDNLAETESGDVQESAITRFSVSASRDASITKEPAKIGYGGKTVKQLVAHMFNNAILKNGNPNEDMVEINLEVLGDPYWLTDNGIGNYLGDIYDGPDSQITSDLTMNHQGADVMIRLIFRTPVEPNLGLEGQGGLYNFPDGEKENPYSGLYKVQTCTNIFSDGAFKQVLRCTRMPNQPQDYDGTPPSSTRTGLLYDTSKQDKPNESPFDWTQDPWGDLDGAIAAQKTEIFGDEGE